MSIEEDMESVAWARVPNQGKREQMSDALSALRKLVEAKDIKDRLESMQDCAARDCLNADYERLKTEGWAEARAVLAAPPAEAQPVTEVGDEEWVGSPPAGAFPVGTAEPMPGASGFTMVVFSRRAVPPGTTLYAALAGTKEGSDGS
jgi:hypothetical protein